MEEERVYIFLNLLVWSYGKILGISLGFSLQLRFLPEKKRFWQLRGESAVAVE
jgi:hypothetical protein